MKARRLPSQETFEAQLEHLINAAIKFGAERRTYSGMKKLRAPKSVLQEMREDVLVEERKLAMAEEDIETIFLTLTNACRYTQTCLDNAEERAEKKYKRQYSLALANASAALSFATRKPNQGVLFEDALARVESLPVSEKQVLEAVKEFQTYKSETEQ